MESEILNILNKVSDGSIKVEYALKKINETLIGDKQKDIRIDMSRKERCGFDEYIYGQNKTPSQLVEIINYLHKNNKVVLVTRVDTNVYEQIKSEIPQVINYDKVAKVIYHFSSSKITKIKSLKAIIVTAGTSDMPVALESKYTIEASGFNCELVCDVGVAGIHRLFDKLEKIKKADLLIVIAGMEGALPSVIGGLVSIPVIAVPTSVGYGTSFNGMTALLGMLNSCASGVAVMNIDNGFGAGCAAVRILNTLAKIKKL